MSQENIRVTVIVIVYVVTAVAAWLIRMVEQQVHTDQERVVSDLILALIKRYTQTRMKT